MLKNFTHLLDDHLQTMQSLTALQGELELAAEILVKALQKGNRIFLCGNGGSAADSQHIAAEIVGRFEADRLSLPAMALTTDSSILTAVGNDFGYEEIFARQVNGLASAGDVLLAYSTSGNSGNVLRASEEAKKKACKVIALSGRGGGKLASLCDANLCVASDNTARIQEAHAFIGHVLCSAIDSAFFEK